MARNLLIEALGAVVRIDLEGVTDADAAAVREVWRDALAVIAPEPFEGPTVVPTASAQLEGVLADLSQRVTLAAIEARRGEVWMLHAAGLADNTGRVVAFVGPSGRGKTTAARTLGEHFGYVSDETVAIGPDGSVLPYRKPLSIIEREGAPKVQRAPGALGLRPLPSAPLRLAAVVLLDRREDAPAEPVVESVDLGDALADLVAQTSYLPDLADPLQTVAAHVAATGGVRRVVYRDAASLVSVVEQLLAPPAGRPPEPAPAPGGRVVGEADVSRPPEPESDPTPRYSRAPFLDALELADPDRIAVLHVDAAGEGTVHVLAGVAPAVWRSADAATIDELAAAAVAAYGMPPDADPLALVSEAVAALVAADTLTLVSDAPERWCIREDVAWTDSGDRVVALSLADDAAAPLALEGSAAAIWRALDVADPLTVAALADRVAADVGVERDVVIDDVSSFVDVLAAAALIGSAPRI